MAQPQGLKYKNLKKSSHLASAVGVNVPGFVMGDERMSDMKMEHG